jgi:formylglycine-generating enzyme required for sulfatase activity
MVVIVLLILVLKYLDGELPGGDATRQSVDQPTFPQWKSWTLRLGGVLLILLVAVAAESFWWLKTTQYSVTETDAEGKKEKEVLYPLPTEYALQRVLWQVGMVKTPAMQEIKAGEFQMGSEKGSDDEKPVHQVTFKQPFNMSRHEITFAEYDYYVWLMQENGLEDVQYPHDQGWGRGSRPVIKVSWEDAQGYVNWLSTETGTDCRLPTEAEWEYAARAGTTTDYFWGDEVGKNNANCDGCGSKWDNKQTAPVGSFPANPFGLQDMHGNVWEWTQDCWHDSYTDAPTDSTAWESGGDCGRRVVRGGSWYDNPGLLRASDRYDDARGGRDGYLGFRVVCGLPLPDR